jgi:hypothetical protein
MRFSNKQVEYLEIVHKGVWRDSLAIQTPLNEINQRLTGFKNSD